VSSKKEGGAKGARATLEACIVSLPPCLLLPAARVETMAIPSRYHLSIYLSIYLSVCLISVLVAATTPDSHPRTATIVKLTTSP
jgi:hypothetical protein